MELYNTIINDEEIIKIYNSISEFEDKDNGWAHHDLKHVKNVAYMVEKILKNLNYDENFIEEAKIAAILHDTGCIKGKDGHAERSYEFAKIYLEKNNIKLTYQKPVLEAIKIHSNGFDTDNIIALALIFSDKLDIKYTRVAKEGYNIYGMRQLQFINDITVNIQDNYLKINFICDKNINIIELEDFYFTDKVFKAIKSFAKKLSLDAIVEINNKKWNKFYL